MVKISGLLRLAEAFFLNMFSAILILGLGILCLPEGFITGLFSAGGKLRNSRNSK